MYNTSGSSSFIQKKQSKITKFLVKRKEPNSKNEIKTAKKRKTTLKIISKSKNKKICEVGKSVSNPIQIQDPNQKNKNWIKIRRNKRGKSKLNSISFNLQLAPTNESNSINIDSFRWNVGEKKTSYTSIPFIFIKQL